MIECTMSKYGRLIERDIQIKISHAQIKTYTYILVNAHIKTSSQ